MRGSEKSAPKKEEKVEATVHTRRQLEQLEQQQQTQIDQQKQQPSVCDICKQQNHLIVCSNCQKGYHSNCHAPKIRVLPDDNDNWLCMDCHPRSSRSNTTKGWLWAVLPPASDDDPSTSLSSDKYKVIKVKIEDPSPTCTACQVLCLEWKTCLQCKACDEFYHLACHDPPLDIKPKAGGLWYWKCTTCKEANRDLLEHNKPGQFQANSTTVKKKRAKKPDNKLVLFDGEHDDDCYICVNGGDLICCDFCEKVFHMACHIPPLPAMPSGIWKYVNQSTEPWFVILFMPFSVSFTKRRRTDLFASPYSPNPNRCCECYATENTEMNRCGNCPACWADEECPYPSYAETYVPGK